MEVVNLKVLPYVLKQETGQLLARHIHKGPLAMGEEGVPGTTTRFMNF